MFSRLCISIKIKELFAAYLESEGLDFDPSLDIEIRMGQFILQSGLLVREKREDFDKAFDRCFSCSEKLKNKKEHVRIFYQGIIKLLEDYRKGNRVK